MRELRWGELIDENDPTKGKWMPLHADQMKVYNSNARFIAAIAGTGGGKTALGPIWCIREIAKAIETYGKCLGFIIAPTYKVLSRATAPTFVDTLAGTQLEGRYLESKSYYELPNKWGRIWLQGADNPGGLEGGQFDFVWGDEGGQFKKKTFDAIYGRTGLKQAPILITTTPYGLSALYHEWYKPWKAGDTKTYFIHQWASHKNPAYPEDEYLRAKRSMSPEKFAERYDGQFMALEGLVYKHMYRCIESLSSDELENKIVNCTRMVGGIDFGWNDPFAALCGLVDKDDVLWIWYERYKSETPIEVHADFLPKFNNKSLIWACDHNPELMRKLKKGGHRVKKAKKDILTGIDMVNRRIYTNKLRIIDNRAPATAAEAEVYAFPEKDGDIIGDKPIDLDNHAMDALRYLVMELDYRKAA